MSKKQMKLIRQHRFGEVHNLVLEESPIPSPGDDEVLIKVHAAGVNYADTMLRKNQYLESVSLPYVPGTEVAGIIVEKGKLVDGLEIGQKVLALLPQRGGYAQFAVSNAINIIPLPDFVKEEEATALLVQGLTAYLLLHHPVQYKEHSVILINAAMGGVGSISVQLAKKLLKFTVIAGVGSDIKAEKALLLGADKAVNYNNPGWKEEVLLFTKGNGVDLILEMVGGKVFEDSLHLLANFGTLKSFGTAGGNIPDVNVVQLLSKNQTVSGFYLGDYFKTHPQRIYEAFNAILNLLGDQSISIQVEHVLPLSQAAKAHELIENRQTIGKVILNPWAD